MADGRRIGFIGDVEINFEAGTIQSLVVPISGKLFSFMSKDKDNDIIIPWDKIRTIGEDIVIVDLDARFLRKYFDY
jgi:YlmC/YmxH family sporulation protein